MARKSFTTVEDFIVYEENDGFSKFEKRKKHKRFDDEIGHRRDRKKTLKDYIKEQSINK